MLIIPDKFTYKTTITNKLRNDIIEKLKLFKETTYLEIGSNKCFTCFALNNFYKKCYAVDTNIKEHDASFEIQKQIEDYLGKKINNIERIHGDITTIKNDIYHVVLIDGKHTYEFVKKDFETLLEKNQAKEYYVFFHDYGLELGGVKKYVDEIKDNYEYFFAGEEKDWNPIGTSPTNDWESICLKIKN